MDSFFGIGAPELILILLLAGIVMGPQRISQAARWLGTTTAQLQRMSRNFMRQLNTELAMADEGQDLKGALDDIQALRRQVGELQNELKLTATRPFEEGKTAIRETQEAVKNTLNSPAAPEPSIASSPKLPNVIQVLDDPEE